MVILDSSGIHYSGVQRIRNLISVNGDITLRFIDEFQFDSALYRIEFVSWDRECYCHSIW
jgi:hypothetical protein